MRLMPSDSGFGDVRLRSELAAANDLLVVLERVDLDFRNRLIRVNRDAQRPHHGASLPRNESSKLSDPTVTSRLQSRMELPGCRV